MGRSPRARGSHPARPSHPRRRGPIPACAGEPRAYSWCNRGCTADPRVRGGAHPRDLERLRDEGRSPRARGSLHSARRRDGDPGPIPACAGEPRNHRWTRRGGRADPRVRGGATVTTGTVDVEEGRSPRARGSHDASVCRLARAGPIPACAGEPPAFSVTACEVRADPRVRGGADLFDLFDLFDFGRSPRARGSPSWLPWGWASSGPIPACAGEPLTYLGTAPAGRPRGPIQFSKSCPADPRSRGPAERARARPPRRVPWAVRREARRPAPPGRSHRARS